MLPLLLLVVQSLIQISAIAAYPVASDFTSPPNTVAYRTIWDIIRSCFATIFSCIWVSVHLNVPEPEGGWHIKWRRRLWATMWALMAPEFVLAWAARQHLAARAIAKKNQELVDGLVVKFMDQEAGSNVENVGEEGVTIESEEGEASGGWLLAPSKDNVNKRSQEWTRTHGFFVAMGGFHLYQGDKPCCPLSSEHIELLITRGGLVPPTKQEIQDKSKGDEFSKGVVILQTAWFVTQCVARLLQHLPITQLELVTIAYTTIIGAIYWCWWDKPLSVGSPIRVYDEKDLLGWKREHVIVESRGILWQYREGTTWSSRAQAFVNSFVGRHDKTVTLSNLKQIPLFYAGNPTDEQILGGDYIAIAVATVFGAIHCLGWFFPFLSVAEMNLWRAASIVNTGYPGALGIGALILFPSFGPDKVHRFSEKWPVLTTLPASGALLYIIARAVLLVVAMTSLRSLPVSAYETVHWSDAIPHF